MSYNFIIQYHQDSLNSADKSSQKSDYITELNDECENSMSEQIDNLISMLVNKLTTVTLKTDEQYNYYIRNTNLETEYLI